MAKQVMPEARLEARPTDVKLTDDLVQKISVFAQLKRKPSLDKFPGSLILRRFKKGEVICRQGDAGWTAFYILTTEDMLALAQSLFQTAPDAAERLVLRAKLALLEQRLAQLKAAPQDESLRTAVTVHLTVARSAVTRGPGLIQRLARRWLGEADEPTNTRPASIPIDAPTDVDYSTMQAVIQEGELFGEMSCMYATPRSATIIAARDCYMLEMLRNILDQLQKDPAYKAYTDEVYKKRIFQLHLRKLSLFADLSDGQFGALRDRIDLVSYDAGQVIYDEYERSDSLYIIRSGLVKVVKKASALLTPDHVRDWRVLSAALREGEAQPTSPRGKVWQLLSESARAASQAIANGSSVPEAQRREILHSLNEVIKNRQLPDAKEFKTITGSSAFQARTEQFPANRKEWSDQDLRRFNRLLLEAVYEGPLRTHHRRVGPDCVLFYASRGEFIGEAGLLAQLPCSETCLSAGHPKDAANGKDGGRVELVRIPAAVFAQLLEISPAIRSKVERKLAERKKQSQERVRVPVWDDSRQILLSQRFEQLGLIQGQKLMLIDLDRCTRCDECVRACATTHDDGRSRLFLDGPRFGKYLVPMSCRSCLDPVCMIGCPVGSIHRGDNGQMVIEDWCIGCGLCAQQCPYGSIQMHDIGIIPEDARGWRYLPASAVGNAPWTRLRYKDRSWVQGTGPFRNDRAFRESLAKYLKKPAPTTAEAPAGTMFTLAEFVMRNPMVASNRLGQQLCFRYAFALASDVVQAKSHFKLEITSPDPALSVWVNGQELVPVDKPKGGKREYRIPPRSSSEEPASGGSPIMRAGRNVLAVQVTPNFQSSDVFLKVRLDEVRKPTVASELAEEVTQKLVTNRAVVCDLCSSQLGQVPACVNACPHDAALRIDARSEFPV
jgi:Fe-S-cluster-containing hydrogenase component 2